MLRRDAHFAKLVELQQDVTVLDLRNPRLCGVQKLGHLCLGQSALLAEPTDDVTSIGPVRWRVRRSGYIQPPTGVLCHACLPSGKSQFAGKPGTFVPATACTATSDCRWFR